MKPFKLQLVTSTPATIEFDVEGGYFPRWVPQYKQASQPHEIETLRIVWEFRNCRVSATDANVLWNSAGPFKSLQAALETRGTGQIVSAKLVDQSSVVLKDLAAGGYVHFRLDEVRGTPDQIAPQDSWSKAANLTVALSAELQNATSAGIVAFEQNVVEEYEDGLRRLEWRTTVSTEEGTDVRTVVGAFARIPSAAVLGDYSWDTNGPTGLDVQLLDADEPGARKPTRAQCRSKIVQWGVTIGATDPNGAPSWVKFQIVNQKQPNMLVVTTTASARGPNARTWVNGNGHRPSAFNYETTIEDAESLGYTHVWENRLPGGLAAIPTFTEVKLTVSQGGAIEDYDVLANGLAAIHFVGGLLPWKAMLEVLVRRPSTDQPTRDDMAFPPLLDDPWRLIQSEVEEAPLPYLVQPGIWERSAKVSYRAVTPPPSSSFDPLTQVASVRSYKS